MKIIRFVLLIIVAVGCSNESNNNLLSIEEVKEDLEYFDNFIKEQSSYGVLSDYSFNDEFDAYLNGLDSKGVDKDEFGLLLAKVVLKFGDRHSNVSYYDLPNSKFLPFVVAPYKEKVVGLKFDAVNQNYIFLHENFPYLKSINGIAIGEFLSQISLRHKLAPFAAFHTRTVKDLKDMEVNYAIMQKEIPELFDFIFTNYDSDTLVQLPLETDDDKYPIWKDKVDAFDLKRGDLNDKALVHSQFSIDADKIGYIRMVDMSDPEEAPLYYDAFTAFMQKANKDCNSLIIDLRLNAGGTRDLLFEFAKYIVHPDSMYVVNVAQQRGVLPLSQDLSESLMYRYLYPIEHFNSLERQKIEKFKQSFDPIYVLDDQKFSPYHYMLLNGNKITNPETYFDKPIYILADEKVFSAASIFVSAFKGLPNVTIAGVTTDGSSGNSEKMFLPNSGVRIKISTMVSFQKNGKLFDGVGTEPDIVIERSMGQVLWNNDDQLDGLKEIIRSMP